MYSLTEERFVALARDYNLIPVFREVVADVDTPVSAFLKLQRGDKGFLLESVEGGETLGRYSFIGLEPFLTISSKSGTMTIEGELDQKLENVAELLTNNNVKFVQGSITDLPMLQRLSRGVEYVFHQAALARVPRSIADPLTTNEVNVTGTLNILLATRYNKVGKVIYASSSSVYGDTVTLPQKEDMPPNPLSPYALTKLAGEYYCNIFRHVYGVSTVSLRYFNVYGPRQDLKSQYATVIPAFIDRIHQGLPPIIHGDGEQSRDFTFIEDVVSANIMAAENSAEGTYNIGFGQAITINHLAESTLSLMEKNLQPIYEKPRPGDPRHTLADVSKAREFGYEPEWSLEEGLRKTIEEFKQ